MALTDIILDFDGVILESVSVKTEAFRTLFSFVPKHVDEIVQFHIDNGGMSRFDKFRYITIPRFSKHYLTGFRILLSSEKPLNVTRLCMFFTSGAGDHSTTQFYVVTGGGD